MMRRAAVNLLTGSAHAALRGPLLTVSCLAALIVACYGGVLFLGQQFAFRDTSHFYYPLYWRVQQEWSAGRLPLRDPGANGGTPMLGSPMAAVLYPGKLVFALVPFAWGMRLYIVGHEVLAFWAMLALLRSWCVSRAGATLAGLSYAFGGPVLSGYFNVIYLVGAAWIPLGFHAADRWLRLGRRWGLVELVLVLAMQVLGGDPQAAYLTVLCAVGYAVGLARSEAGIVARPAAWLLGLVAVAAGWTGAGPLLSRLFSGGGGGPRQALLLATWAVILGAYIATRPPGHRARMTAMLAGLTAAGILSLLLTAVQVLPVLEQTAASVRWASAGPEDLFDSSLVPYRLVEWIWPNVFGTFTEGNRYWISILPPAGAQRPSPLSLYAGALPLVLALGAVGLRGGPPWRAWMSAVVLMTFLGSLGKFAGPSGWTADVGRGVEAGPDRLAPPAGDDSFYGLLTTTLPALRLFRFPFKLLPFTTLGLAALAGLGWDLFAKGIGRRRTLAIGGGLLILTILCLTSTLAMRGRLIAAIAARGSDHAVFGPFDPSGSTGEIVRGLTHGAVALAAGLAILVGTTGRRRSTLAAIAVVVLTVDLAFADAPLVITIPQVDFEVEPEVVRAIREAERADPSPGPFRVQRLPSWVPVGWATTPSPRRLRELVDWEIETLQPNFGWLHGMEYTFVDESEMARADLRRLFQPARGALDTSLATALGIPTGRPVLYHPRGVFDLWGARYFITPAFPGDWDSAYRSYAAFVDQTDLIYPPVASLEGPGRIQDRQRWLLTKDFLVRRNRRAFPRAWVVHEAQVFQRVDEAYPARRDAIITRFRSAVSASPSGPDPGPDLRKRAYVETDLPTDLIAHLQGRDALPPQTSGSGDDRLTVLEASPTRLIIGGDLQSPGLVVVSNLFETGWHLAIDGRPAPLLRANLLMQAAAVAAGKHTLVYTYDPPSVHVGAWMSLSGLVTLFGMAGWASRGPAREPACRVV